MRKIFLLLLVSCSTLLYGQSTEGKVVMGFIESTALQNNAGENSTRRFSVYLPPGYEESTNRYPVIYYLHGFTGTDTIVPAMKEVLDMAIATKRIRPFILVIPDQLTTYGGSFYGNSSLTGNWSDFTAKELVAYMDKTYRTIPDRDSRGITGHSMGGHGALKLGMLFPGVFSSVYALSPGALTIVREYGPNSDTYKQLQAIKTVEELNRSYFPKVIVAFAKTWSPNPNKPPFYVDIPFEYEGDSLIVHQDVLEKWYENMPLHMIDEHLDDLKKLKAIKLDWGRNAGDRFLLQCMLFSQRLENVGIEHFAEEYIGTHVSGIWTKDGRVITDMLPFFDHYLDFD